MIEIRLVNLWTRVLVGIPLNLVFRITPEVNITPEEVRYNLETILKN
jgi:hypothetical protein